MQNELATYRAKSFTAEANKSSIAYEVKRTRAVFDNSLSIPGTNRRGGWRCPPGTRYGGQITDRFGRNCGWGVSRRIANEISDIGERLESVSERRQRRREARVSARRGRPGVVERAAGRLADVLETDSPAEETPRRGRQQRGPSRRRPNLRDSEQRRMDREIDEPGALRTGQSRRRRATTEVVDRPRPPAPVAEPAKKVPAKKVPAKKKAAKKKAPAKKAAAKKRVAKKAPAKLRVDSDNAANSERLRQARAEKDQPDWEAFGALPDGPEGIAWDDLDNVLGGLYRENGWANIENRARNVANFARTAQDNIDRILKSNQSDAAKAMRIQEKLNDSKAQANRYLTRLNDFRQRFENEPDAALRKQLADDIYGANQALLGKNLEALKYEQALKKIRKAPKAPAKKAPVKKTGRSKVPAKLKLDNQRERIQAAGYIGVGDTPLNADQLLRFGGVLEADFNGMQERIELGKELLMRDMPAWNTENIAELRAVVAGSDAIVNTSKRELQLRLDRMRTLGPNASDSEFQRLKADVIAANIDYAGMLNRRKAFTDRLAELKASKKESAPEPMDGLRAVFAGRRPGFERDWDAERRRVSDMAGTFVNLDEDAVTAKIRDINQNLDYNREYLNNLTAMNPEQRIQLPNRVVKAGDLKDEVQGVVDAWQGAKDAANDRLIRINSNRLPGLAGQRILRGQNIDGFGTVEIAERQFNELLTNNPDTRFNLINHNGRFYAVSQSQLDNARLNGLNNPTILKTKGGLPLANELPPVDAEVARQAKERVDKAIKQRQDVLAGYLDKRYGSGNAPWKEMTAERRIELAQRAAQGDSAAKRELREWAKAMYSHDEIEGKNGKTYRIVATPTVGSQSIKIVSQIQRKQADGTWLDVGGSERTIYHNAVPAHVYNNSMFINVAADKNAGIQTIYNQHAWMYAQASGFEYISVSAVQDGPYVWGRVGFTEEIRPAQIVAMNAQVANFRDGQGNSIVKNETDARILEHLIGEYIRNPRSVRHADFILALTIEGSPAEKKEREKELRDWFVVNMQFGSGKLNLNDNKISADPRERVRT